MASVIPGDIVGTMGKYIPGEGVYVFDRDNSIRSSLVGNCVLETRSNGDVAISVINPFFVSTEYVIAVGDVVVSRILRTNYNQAYVDILCVGDRELSRPIKGVIRREDIRQSEIDKVVVADFFHPGDIVRTSVISLCDSKYYFLSTAAYPPAANGIQFF
jgi:exosome complex component CSL4